MTQLGNKHNLFSLGKIPTTVNANIKSQWLDYDSADRYKTHGNKDFAPDSVSYDFNSLGYRCDEFSAKNTGQTIFIGCSVTMGEAVPVNSCWAHLVHTYLQAKDTSQDTYINLAYPGSSWDYVARTLLQVIPILRPKRVMAYMPALTRREIFHLDSFDTDVRPFHWLVGDRNSPDMAEGLNKVATYDGYVMYRTLSNKCLIESMCQAYGVELYWTCWDRVGVKILPEVFSYGTWFNFKYDRGFHYHPPGRDGDHPGLEAHREIADEFIAHLKE